MNIFGPSKSFMPLVFLDSFLLAMLGLIFVFLPEFKKQNLIFIFFTVFFILQGLFIVGYFPPGKLEVIMNAVFLIACALLYSYQLRISGKIAILNIIPIAAFLFSLLLGYLQLPTVSIVICSGIGALVQVYILARPEILVQMPVFLKRFYLLMTAQVVFDTISYLFFRINAPEVNIHY
jgi:hypothetical protein